ncbi:hypothetical protein AB1K83_01385 [Sporosarcina sp. 179-K 3D1 HS]
MKFRTVYGDIEPTSGGLAVTPTSIALHDKIFRNEPGNHDSFNS